MALIKARPKIRLLVPSEVHPGDSIEASIVLDARREVPVEHIDVQLTTEERVRVGQGNQARSYKRLHTVLQARLSEAATLPKGTTRYPCRFDLMKNAPASYSGTAATIEYVVVVQVAIPWWPDAKGDFVVQVTPRPRERQTSERVYTTHEGGPTSKEPYLEFMLHQDVILPGDTLRGEVALYNVNFNRYRLLVLSLVGKEVLITPEGKAAGASEAYRFSARLPVEHPEEGEPFDFAIKLPDTLAPSFAAKLSALQWSFEIEAKIAWSHSLSASVPLEVLPTGSQRAARPRYAVPTIGSPRLLALWKRVAEEHGIALDEVDRRMRARAGEVAVEIGREHRGADGIYLTATLRYPALGLDIDGGLASGFRRVIGGGIEIGNAAWDKRHYLTGREPAQITAFCATLSELLLQDEQTALGDIDDEHLVLEMRDAGQSHGPLHEFVGRALALAARVGAARAAVPAPAAMLEAVPAWRRLARELEGTLDLACMSIMGQFEGTRCAVMTRWSPKGDALHTEIALDTAQGLLERHRLVWSEGVLIAGNSAELPTRARELCETLLAGALSLTLERARIVLWDMAPALDIAPLRTRLGQLAALSAALRGAHGPYR